MFTELLACYAAASETRPQDRGPLDTGKKEQGLLG